MSANKAAVKTANTAANIVNGLDLDALHAVADAIALDPKKAQARFQVSTEWQGQTRSLATISGFDLAGERVQRRFAIAADEPSELLGTNTAPNPQELLLAALNACMSVGYVAGAATRGITLTALRIESEAALDLRGFLGYPEVPAGAPEIRLKVTIAGNGSADAFREIHAQVQKTSPNLFHLTQPIKVAADLAILA
jgi:uncharacterized OsmC-like protein